MGNLTRDPELRVTPKGTAICQFGLAINRDWKNEAGEKQSEVTFVDCEAWAKTGETIAKYLTKGRPLFVEGRIKLEQWEDKNTHEKRSRIKILVESFQFLGSREDSGGGGSSYGRSAPAERSSGEWDKPTTPASKPDPAQNLDEDVPF